MKNLLGALVLGSVLVMGCAGGQEASEGPGLEAAQSALTMEQCEFFHPDDSKITICHATSSTKNPWVIVRINKMGCGGHENHAGDWVDTTEACAANPKKCCKEKGCYPEGAPFDDTVDCCFPMVPRADEQGLMRCTNPCDFIDVDDGKECTIDTCDRETGLPVNTPVEAGVLCGDQETDTECDKPDTCDGAGECLPNFEPVTANCGDAGTECVIQDKCDGEGQCLDNGFQGVGTACGSASDVACDAADTCDGAGVCVDNVKASGFVCLAGELPCNPDDVCDGATKDCAVVLAAVGTECGSGSNEACDAPDTCDGLGACIDNVKVAGFVCLPGELPCNPDDVCDGAAKLCAPLFAAAGAACGSGSNEACDAPDTCNGVGSCIDNVKAAGFACRSAAGECDLAEVCTGVDNICPANVFKSASSICRGSAGMCDVVETCSGVGPACPSDMFMPSTTVCRAAVGTCDVQEKCSGSAPQCPADLFAASGVSCGKAADFCYEADLCNGQGACVVGVAVHEDTLFCDSFTDLNMTGWTQVNSDSTDWSVAIIDGDALLIEADPTRETDSSSPYETQQALAWSTPWEGVCVEAKITPTKFLSSNIFTGKGMFLWGRWINSQSGYAGYILCGSGSSNGLSCSSAKLSLWRKADGGTAGNTMAGATTQLGTGTIYANTEYTLKVCLWDYVDIVNGDVDTGVIATVKDANGNQLALVDGYDESPIGPGGNPTDGTVAVSTNGCAARFDDILVTTYTAPNP